MANLENLAVLRQGAKKWNQSRDNDSSVQADLIGAKLSGADLSGVDLSKAVLSGADLSGADLSGARLNGADLSGADLNGADLSRAKLSGVTLGGADLNRANLNGADLSGGKLSGVNLGYANLSGASLSVVNLSGANLSGADLSGANLSGANLSVAKLNGANLSGADLSGANFSGADLSGVDLSGADLRMANLNGANLSRANLQNAHLELRRLTQANLNGANLIAACLWETQHTGWSIKGTICESASGESSRVTTGAVSSRAPERSKSETPTVTISYQDGLSPLELATLPALIKHLEELHPGCGLRLVHIGEEAGGVVVGLAIDGAGNNSDEQLTRLRATLEADARQKIEYQRLALADRKTRLQLEGRAQELDSFIDDLLLKPSLVVNADRGRGDDLGWPAGIDAAGPIVSAAGLNFDRIGEQIEKSIDLARLAEHLATLRQSMSRQAIEAEHYVSVGNVARAEQAARAQDPSKVAEMLRAAGNWALEVAEQTGASPAADAIRCAQGSEIWNN